MKDKSKEKLSVGGQAVIEGVMMKGVKTVVAVRKKDGSIVVSDYGQMVRPKGWKGWPFIRGTFVLYDSLVSGIKALNLSANLSGDEDNQLSTKDIFFALLIAFGMAIGLFSILPVLITSLFSALRNNGFLFALVEGGIRTVIFLIYIWIIAMLPDIKRVFQYHGAEHKSVFTYEAGEELTVENARKYSTLHPRCGTSFLMITMIAAIIVFSILGGIDPQMNIWWKFASRIILIPVVAGLAYEFQRMTAKHLDNPFFRALAKPGLWLQKLTTKEPDDLQLEVGLAALKASLGQTESEDVQRQGVSQQVQ
ncbi:DUF1385 domain-containing protein [Athalassotoga saccharophila]|uniref:DUF1385 domain-containing protein n=1 Tax=Athalassotoga saccharophila TaxID=1441386 RepID=UPI0018D5AA38|nr:DUF1385 domain-containing protein [Athalassotoga saccharophila]BBJ27472.1 hypothetical protein ATHSA_0341 [Athalassotoga saccharophila]